MLNGIRKKVRIIRKVCVIGAGSWGSNHIRILYEMGYLVGIVEKKPSIIKDVKRKYSNLNLYDNLDDALSENIDAYIVCTPPKTHYSIAKRILLAKKHVLVEKPITTNLNEAIELNNIAKSNKLILMVGHVLLFHPAFKKIKKIIDEGKIGKLQYIYSNRLNLGTIRNYENVLWSFAPHDIALFQNLIGKKPIDIFSKGTDILQNDIHDTTVTCLKYDNKVMGHIFVSWLHPFKEHRFVVVGSKGMLHFEDSISDKPLLFYDKNIEWRDGMPLPRNGNVEKIDYDSKLPLDEELKYFVKCLEKGKIDICNGDSAVEVMEILTECGEKLNE